MIDPYRMVIVNTVCSFLILIGMLLYRYIYPKKKINLFALLLIISILPIISVFRIGDYESGDFNIHIYRIMSFYDSLMEGNLMPSWAGELNATYGNPLFIFNYSLPYYVVSLFHFIGFSFITSMKIFLGLALYLSGIFMYFWIKELTGSKLAAFTAGIFYLFAPYHLIDVHFRATLGEATIFCIAPLLFLFLIKYSKNNKLIYLVAVSMLTYLLFLAHPLLAGVFLGISALYIVFTELTNKNIKSMLLQLLALFIGIIISAYIWAPHIIYSPYMFHFPSTDNVGFYPFNLLFYSPWRFGLLFQGPKGELATIIGYTQIFVLLTSIVCLVTNKFSEKIKRHIVFWIILFLVTLFMMNPLSNIFWKYTASVGPMLISYSRLSLALAFFTSIIAGYFVLHFASRKRLVYLLLLLTIGSTILNWGHRRVIPEINDDILRKNVPFSTLTEGPSNYLATKWVDSKNPWFSEVPQSHLEIINGKGNVKELKRTSTKHIYFISASTPLTIRENTLYFPGWSVKSNGENVPIYPDKEGVITANLPSGLQNIELSYNDLPLLKLSKIISLIIICASLIYAVRNYLALQRRK